MAKQKMESRLRTLKANGAAHGGEENSSSVGNSDMLSSRDSGLERRADGEGAPADGGLSAFDSKSGQTISPMSEVTGLSSAPIQAKKPDIEYTPSAAEQFNDRLTMGAGKDDAYRHTPLSEIAFQRSLMSQQEQPTEFSPEYEAAYQKKISSMNMEEMTALLSQHSKNSDYTSDLLQGNRDFFYNDSLANTELGEEGSQKFANGIVNYNMSGANTADQFLGFESLLKDIQANPDSKSAKNLSKLTGEGGQFEHMQGVKNMRSLMNMSDADVDSAIQSRKFTQNKAPIAGVRQQKNMEKLDQLHQTQNFFTKKKMRSWWQFWK